MTNHVENAVAPLKAEAIARAEVEANKLIERVLADLAEHGMDRQSAAPFPRSMNCTREQYVRQRGKYQLYRAFTKAADRASSRSPNDPDPCVRDEERVARFIEAAKEDAALQYDAFVAKLVAKVGECDSATLAGSHVWGSSVLTVTKGSTVERWKTQQIVNVSKLGKLFNQWPTRKAR